MYDVNECPIVTFSLILGNWVKRKVVYEWGPCYGSQRGSDEGHTRVSEGETHTHTQSKYVQDHSCPHLARMKIPSPAVGKVLVEGEEEHSVQPK